MSSFDRLHPSVQHHVVNSLGWSTLRPHQEQAIDPILSGANVLIQAPTAGGKTEAALLPILSQMIMGDWRAPSILYLCPIIALINDLESRIDRLAGLFGRRVAVWHGDVTTTARRRIVRDPPDILLSTPESVEVMLVSRMVEHRPFFASLRAIVVDEIHAFAGDDRGWHLLGLLERITRLAGGPVQRIALSATVANPDELLKWLVSDLPSDRCVISNDPPTSSEVHVEVDYVGSLENAALIISRLHSGEKRLVFCDSRSQVESLASELRAHRVDTYVSHSSLSRDERRRAETAFAQGSDCVIVATSTLELGLDVGDLDRVIQIDAPFTVASFLQRLGRSGRRAGSRRNCLFLATTDDALLRAVAMLALWKNGFVEPVLAPPLPFHVLAQQVIALTLQEGGVAFDEREEWLGQFRKTAGISKEDADRLLTFMISAGILFEDGGILSIGPEGESAYGRQNFREIFSIFMSPPLFTIYHGRREIGEVHEGSFRSTSEGPQILSLAGRGWRVTHLDWDSRRAYVEPAELRGRSRWLGVGQRLRFELAQAIKGVLINSGNAGFLSRRAADQLAILRGGFIPLDLGTTEIVPEAKGVRWWTFAGDRYNGAISAELNRQGQNTSYDSFSVRMKDAGSLDWATVLRAAAIQIAQSPFWSVEDEALSGRIKFIDCVPSVQRKALIAARFGPGEEADAIQNQKIRVQDTGLSDR